jgi:glycogen synthase
LKVLIYTEYFFPISGGVQTNVFELACGLTEWRSQSENGALQVTVVTRTREATANDKSWPFTLVRHPNLRELLALFRSADVIHIAGPALAPMALSVLLRKPAVVEHHGYQALCPNGILLLADRTVCPGHFMASRYWKCAACNAKDMGWAGSLRSLVLMAPRRMLSKFMSANIAITDHVAAKLALPRTKTVLYGIRDSGYRQLPQNGHGFQIGYVGRLVPEKGVPILLRAAKRLSDDGLRFHLTIVGDGPLRQQLEDETRKLGIAGSVTFTGDLAGSALEKVVGPLQTVVMPSVWEETAGLTAIEQMMRGGVVVAADIGGLSEIVGDDGLKFAPGDDSELYLRLREVIEHPDLVGSLSVRARARALKFHSRNTMIESHISVYEHALRL